VGRTLRFHLDEMCDPRIAVALGQRGIDVTTAKSAGLLGASDSEQLAYARHQGRVTLTHDVDFLRLHAAGAQHPGIVYCPPNARPLGELIRLLALMWELSEPGDMRQRVEFL
jgi:hypothetical protein